MKKLLFLMLFTATSIFAKEADPFAKITFHQLENGMKVILAPNSKIDLVKIKVNVGVGFVHEHEENYGVSHLLEHVLFRNDTLKDDMSYLQLIQEKEGEANGVTSWDQTRYFATVKKQHAEWLLTTIHTMMMNPTLSPKHIESEKKTVLLEIGEPNQLIKMLGFDPFRIFTPAYLKQPTYWENEFDVKLGHHYSRTEEQLATLRLTPSQINEHYKKFYDPSNMQILISGGFNPETILRQIQQSFGKHLGNSKGDLRPSYVPKLKNRPYNSFDVSSGTPRISLGYQVGELSYKDKEVINSYTDYLSHRLMKKLRNLNGETYTVRDRSDLLRHFGYFAIGFQTSREKFADNLKIVEDILKSELVDGKLAEADIDEAKRLYLNSFVLWGEGAESMDNLADKMLHANEKDKTWKSPIQVLSNVTNKEYLEILIKHADKKHMFKLVTQPEVFFQYDVECLLGICCIIFFFMFRMILLKPFNNAHVQWVRKVRYPPLKMLEIGVSIFALLLYAHVEYINERYIIGNSFIKSTGILANYLDPIWGSFTVIFVFQAVISFLPRKFYFMEDHLVIKSLSYFSKHIPASQIKSVTHENPLSLFLQPRKMIRLWNSFFYFDLAFWKRGLLIELQGGKLYFFSTKDSIKVAQELNEFVGIQAASTENTNQAA